MKLRQHGFKSFGTKLVLIAAAMCDGLQARLVDKLATGYVKSERHIETMSKQVPRPAGPRLASSTIGFAGVRHRPG